jgi:ribonuclease D
MKVSFVKNRSELTPLIEIINQAKIIAIDTEFDREKTYYPILSLIQIAVKQKDEINYFIIDALEIQDLSEFVKIIFDKKIKKIFHSSIQDLQIFAKSIYQPNQKEISNLASSLIDTQIMANLCGIGFNVGYGFLVENFFDKKIDKSLQRSKWLARPLDQDHLNYAILDVVYLHEIFERLNQILIDKQRANWYQEEVEFFVNAIFSEDKKSIYNKFNLSKMNQQQVFLLKNLINWREQKAKEINIPRQHFIKDCLIENIVINKNDDWQKKLDIKKIAEIREIFDLKKEEDDDEFFRNFCYKLNKQDKEKIENIEKKISEIAIQNQIASQFLMSKEVLKKIFIFNKNQQKSSNSVENFAKYITNWRYHLLIEII